MSPIPTNTLHQRRPARRKSPAEYISVRAARAARFAVVVFHDDAAAVVGEAPGAVEFHRPGAQD